MVKIKLFLTIIFLLVGGSVHAATITVCASGCDYTTVQAGVNAAGPDDTILISDGDYSTEDIIISTGGTSDSNRLIIQAETAGAVYLSSIASDGPDYITIDGINITDDSGYGIYFEYCDGCTVKNSVFRNNDNAGIVYWYGSDGIVEYSEFYDDADPDATDMDYGIAFYYHNDSIIRYNYFYGRFNQTISWKYGCNGGLAEYNTLEGVVSTGIYLGQHDGCTTGGAEILPVGGINDHRYEECTNLTAQYNHIKKRSAHGMRTPITVRNVNGAIVRNNLIEGVSDTGSGVGIYVYYGIGSEPCAPNAGDINIYNNVIRDSVNGRYAIINKYDPANINNNTFVNTGGVYPGYYEEDSNNYIDDSYDYNINPDYFAGPLSGFTQIGAASAIFTPTFARAHAFRLTSASVNLVDQGVPVFGVTTDFDGTVRPQGTAYDIGAFEYSLVIEDESENFFRGVNFRGITF